MKALSKLKTREAAFKTLAKIVHIAAVVSIFCVLSLLCYPLGNYFNNNAHLWHIENRLFAIGFATFVGMITAISIFFIVLIIILSDNIITDKIKEFCDKLRRCAEEKR